MLGIYGTEIRVAETTDLRKSSLNQNFWRQASSSSEQSQELVKSACWMGIEYQRQSCQDRY